MALARMLAEFTVLIILIVLPFVLFFTGQFNNTLLSLKIAVCIMCPIAFLIAYGFMQIPYLVLLTDEYIETKALLKRKKASWQDMTSLRLSNKWGWRHYKLEFSGGELIFPYMLNKVNELAEEIRSKLPNRGRVSSGQSQFYKLSNFAMLFQGSRIFIEGLFLILFWIFTAYLMRTSHNHDDKMIIIVATVLLTALMSMRIFRILQCPNTVELNDEKLILACLGKTKEIICSEITKITLPSPFLPEGIILHRTKKSNVYLASELDGFDELQEELKSRLILRDSNQR